MPLIERSLSDIDASTDDLAADTHSPSGATTATAESKTRCQLRHDGDVVGVLEMGRQRDSTGHQCMPKGSVCHSPHLQSNGKREEEGRGDSLGECHSAP